MARLIDADALVERHCEDCGANIRAICKSDPVCAAVLWLNEAPTIEAEPVRHSRWKYYHKQNIAVCMNCSFERDLDANFGKAISCPNCGAKMEMEDV